MRSLPSRLVLLSGSLALSACAGGASSTATVGNAPTLDVREAAFRAPFAAAGQNGSVSNPYPFAQGDSFTYAHRESHSEEEPGKPLTKVSTTGSTTETIGATTSFDGRQLTAVANVLTYTSVSNHGVTTTGSTSTTDYETFAAVKSGLDYENFGSTVSGNSNSSTGVTTTSASTTTYAGGYLLNEIPELRGASWNDEIGYTLSSQSSSTKAGVTTDGQTTFTRHENGTYTRTTTSTSGSVTTTETDTQEANGSGEEQNSGSGTTTFSAPRVGAGGKFEITVVHTPLSGSQTTTIVPDWFPGNGPAGKLVSDERKDEGTASVPAECGATAGQQATVIRELFSALDVVRGTYETLSLDQFVVPGEGRVCGIQQELLNTYDNTGTGALLVSERTNLVNSLTSESIGQLRARHVVSGFGII